MAGYLFAYFNFSGGKPFPAPHLTDIRGSSQPFAILSMPLPVLSPCSLLLHELCCCSALTAMVTSKRHGHLIYQAKEKSAGVCVCTYRCARGGNGISLSFFFSFLRSKHFIRAAEKRLQLTGTVSGCRTGAVYPISLLILGWPHRQLWHHVLQGMLVCSLCLTHGSAATRS